MAHLRMLTGVLKLDFWGSRKVAFTFGALRSDTGVCRVPDFGQLLGDFLQEKSLFCLLAENTFEVEKFGKCLEYSMEIS